MSGLSCPRGAEELVLNKLEEECEEEGGLVLSQGWEMLHWAWGLNAKRGLVLCAWRFTGAQGCSVVVKTVVLPELSSLVFRWEAEKRRPFLALVCGNDERSRAGLSWASTSNAVGTAQAHPAVWSGSEGRNSNTSCKVRPSGDPLSALVRCKYLMVNTYKTWVVSMWHRPDLSVGAGWCCVAEAVGLPREVPRLCTRSQMLHVSAKAEWQAIAHSRQYTEISHWALLSAGLNWVAHCNCCLNAPIASSCNHKIYSFMEIRAELQEPLWTCSLW